LYVATTVRVPGGKRSVIVAEYVNTGDRVRFFSATVPYVVDPPSVNVTVPDRGPGTVDTTYAVAVGFAKFTAISVLAASSTRASHASRRMGAFFSART
jgi:hypothetical protein